MAQGTVLICLSGADHIRSEQPLLLTSNAHAHSHMHALLACRTKDGKKQETGFFLKELGAPLVKIPEAGYDVQVHAYIHM